MQYTLDRAAQLMQFKEATEVPWNTLSADKLLEFKQELRNKKFKASTHNKLVLGVRGVIEQTENEDLKDRCKQILSTTYVKPHKHGKALSGDEIASLFEVCESDLSASGIRDGLAIALMLKLGLRRAEVVNLKTSKFDRNSGVLKVERARGRVDEFPLADFSDMLSLLAMWLEIRERALLASETDIDTLLLRIDRRGHIVAKGMSSQALMLRVKIRAAQANIREISPQDLRRTYLRRVIDLKDAIADHSIKFEDHVQQMSRTKSAVRDLDRRTPIVPNFVDRA